MDSLVIQKKDDGTMYLTPEGEEEIQRLGLCLVNEGGQCILMTVNERDGIESGSESDSDSCKSGVCDSSSESDSLENENLIFGEQEIPVAKDYELSERDVQQECNGCNKCRALENKLDQIVHHLADLNEKFSANNIIMSDLMKTVKLLQGENKEIRNNLRDANDSVKRLQSKNSILDRKVLELQCREMENEILIFGVEEKTDEIIESEVDSFLKDQLQLQPKDYPYTKIHRLGKFQTMHKHKPRPVLLRLLKKQDKEQILQTKKILRGTNFGINECFPKEIEQHRKKLYPILKKAKADGKKALIKVDTLYIDGEIYEDLGAGPIFSGA